MKRGRRWLVWLTTLSVVATLVLSTWLTLAHAGKPSLGCPVLGNGVVPTLARLFPACPLSPFDRVERFELAGRARFLDDLDDLKRDLAGRDAVRFEVVRAGQKEWIAVPVVAGGWQRSTSRLVAAAVLAGVVLAAVLLLASRTRANAVTAFSVFYATLAVGLIAASGTSERSELLLLPSTLALGFLPASILHLALCFPREGKLVARHPQLALVPYVFAGVIALLSLASYPHYPAAFALLARLLLTLSTVAFLVLALRCLLTLGDGSTPVERRQAQVFLASLAVAYAVPTLLRHTVGEALWGGPLQAVTLGLAISPIPLGYAIARYQLFDLDMSVRRRMARMVYLLAGTLVLYAGVRVYLHLARGSTGGDPLVLFVAVFLVASLGEWVRARGQAAIERWLYPRDAQRERIASECAARMASQHDADDCARLTALALAEGLGAEGVSLFLGDRDSLRPAHAVGRSSSVDPALGGAALDLIGLQRGPVSVRFTEEDSPAVATLRAARVELVCALRSGDALLGAVLVSTTRDELPYTSRDLVFFRSLSAQAAVALHAARLAAQLRASERYAAAGRVRSELAHEIGKPLGALEILASRLPGRLGDPSRAERDARTIDRLAREVRRLVRDVLREEPGQGGGEAATDVSDLVERAVETVAESFGENRVLVRVPEALELAPVVAAGSSRLLVNLLDNALRASEPEQPVEVSAHRDGEGIALEVVDRGSGMSAHVQANAFTPFFTTRGGAGGTGLGLAISKEIVASVGGRIDLQSEPGSGTRVRVWLPGEDASGAAGSAPAAARVTA